MAEEKEGQGGGNTYINMTGGIIIKNIQHVEHLHAVPEKEEKEDAATPPGQPSQDDALVELLLPVFYKNADEARDFLQFARGLDGTTITQRVTDLVAKGKIDPRKAKRELYCILRGHGIYNFSESNWNKQVRI